MRAIRLIAAKIAILLFAAPNLRNDLLGFFDELLGIFLMIIYLTSIRPLAMLFLR